MGKEKVKPIGPSEVVKLKQESIPSEVFEVFNELITKNMNGYYANVRQKDAVALLVKKGLKSADIFDNHWLDVEDIYRKAGWSVEYDKPAYNEDYEAYFVFKPKRRQSVQDDDED